MEVVAGGRDGERHFRDHDGLRQVFATLAGCINGQSFLRTDRATPDPYIVDEGIGDASTAPIRVDTAAVLGDIHGVAKTISVDRARDEVGPRAGQDTIGINTDNSSAGMT